MSRYRIKKKIKITTTATIVLIRLRVIVLNYLDESTCPSTAKKCLHTHNAIKRRFWINYREVEEEN